MQSVNFPGKKSEELVVLVEDDEAKLIIESSLPMDIRKRIEIIYVGSHSAVMKCMWYFQNKSICKCVCYS